MADERTTRTVFEEDAATSGAQRSSRRGSGSRSGASGKRSGGSKRGGTQVPRRRIPVGAIILAVIACAAVLVAVPLFSTALAVDITVNGTPLSIRGAKTLQVAIKESGLPINPGDLISLQGNVLEKSAGKPVTALVNGEEVFDLDMPLHNGDEVQLSDGGDVLEDYDETIEVIPHTAEDRGIGVFRMFENAGFDGAVSHRTGKISGETVSKQIFYPETLVYTRYNPDVGRAKIVALTFDEGPSASYTEQVLDVLEANDVRATFFVLGNSIQEIGNEWLVQRAADEGHQICTHTYDNAIAVGEQISALEPLEQIKEIQTGRAAISEALGTDASRVMRLPGSDMDAETLCNLEPYIGVEVGWNVDTEDARGASAEAIADALLGVTPGDVVLLHDGGGDRSATVEALRTALPKLKKAGWRFVTIDELLEFPPL